ncbi:hypothetical protein L596_020215 [Steinernema carpocapsae]|uniref:Uncharacterized protein n=1 Tax=Steinernema carpocapsae TaxID=34508 RepID=A0A4U5MSV1_STECR|nr:hypothetical protein L596_020215 [Steinernema carpocapsae]
MAQGQIVHELLRERVLQDRLLTVSKMVNLLVDIWSLSGDLNLNLIQIFLAALLSPHLFFRHALTDDVLLQFELRYRSHNLNPENSSNLD